MTATKLLCGRPHGHGRIHRKQLGQMTLLEGSKWPSVEPNEGISWGAKLGWDWEQQFIVCPRHGPLTIDMEGIRVRLSMGGDLPAELLLDR